MSEKIPESQSDSSLPMVIYLRGDEELVDEFSLDADDAMNILGIKRSRLTQISGRDLRVGRIRRDRYIRPVYRLKDLQDYQSWTRSTASHQSSSMLVEQVIDRLSEQCSKLEHVAVGVYEQQLQQAIMQMHEGLGILIGKLQASLGEQARLQDRRTYGQGEQANRLLQGLILMERELQTMKSLLQSELGQFREILTVFHRDLSELTSLIKHLPAKLNGNLETMRQAWQQALEQRLETLEKSWERQAKLDLESQERAQNMHTAALLEQISKQTAYRAPGRRQVPARQRLKQQAFTGRRLILK